VGPPPLALNHLNLPARDPEAQARWYVEKMGFSRNGRFLWSGGTLLVFVKGEAIPSGALHFGFKTATRADLDAWVARLAARGVHVPPVEVDDDYARTLVRDPEGNEIELFHEPVSAGFA
jgi:catechol 2,3-dioxygenase-like lactoylglutathione lyase family enzyme